MWYREPITALKNKCRRGLFFSPSSPFSLMLAIFPRVDWLSLKLNAGTIFSGLYWRIKRDRQQLLPKRKGYMPYILISEMILDK